MSVRIETKFVWTVKKVDGKTNTTVLKTENDIAEDSAVYKAHMDPNVVAFNSCHTEFQAQSQMKKVMELMDQGKDFPKNFSEFYY